jgi:hypothetical protein
LTDGWRSGSVGRDWRGGSVPWALNFLNPARQPDYGLTGQQFPRPTLSEAPSDGISVAKGSSLGWLEGAGSVGTESVSLDLSEQARRLWYLLQYAKGQCYDPQATLSLPSEATTAAKRFALQARVLWSTSDPPRSRLWPVQPGVTPALGAALRIPPLTYVVGNTVGGPGVQGRRARRLRADVRRTRRRAAAHDPGPDAHSAGRMTQSTM